MQRRRQKGTTGAAAIGLGSVVSVWVVLMGAVATPPDARARLDRMGEAEVGDPIPPGWEVRAVNGYDAPTSRVIEEAESGAISRAIHFEARGRQAGFFWLELDTTLDPDTHHLGWSWQVNTPIAGVDLRRPELDDSPARFFVAFGRGGLFSGPKILFYSWGGADDIGDHFTHPNDDSFRVLVLRNARSPLNSWVHEERDLGADYRLVFGEEPPEVTAVGFMVDTDQTGAAAAARLGPVEAVQSDGGAPKTSTPQTRR